MRCSSQRPPASRKVRTPLSALMPAPVSTKTRCPRFSRRGANSSPGAIFGKGNTLWITVAQLGRARKDRGMELRRELSRQVYVRSRVARAAAVRIAYLAYSRALLRWNEPSSKEAALSLRARIEKLFEEDWLDAEAGFYPREIIEALSWREYAQALPRLIADLPRTRARIGRGDFRELPEEAAPERYPRYYARNFHYQSEGYLGHTSAALYDLQVELLFGGTADAMRRRIIPHVVRLARSRNASVAAPLRVLDVACGTGHLLGMLGAALPGEAKLFGVDLSPHYIARAREVLPRDLDVSLVCDNAENLPFLD